MSGIKGGFLFPSPEQLAERNTAPTKHLEYETMLSVIKELCTDVLKKDLSSEAMKKMIFGTHCLRRTFFMHAYWGFRQRFDWAEPPTIEQANLSKSARHKSAHSSMTYINDAGTLFEHFIRSNDESTGGENKVGVWVPIYMNQLDSYESMNTAQPLSKPVHQLADEFVFGTLGVRNDGRLGRKSIWDVFELSMAKPEASLSDMDQITSLMTSLDVAAKNQMYTLINTLVDKKVSAALDAAALSAGAAHGGAGSVLHLPVAGPADAATAAVGGPTLCTPSPTNKKRKQAVVQEVLVAWDKDYAALVKTAGGKKQKKLQVELIVEAVAAVKQQQNEGKSLRDPVKTVAFRMGKIASCVCQCHNNDVDSFLVANPTFTTSRFKCAAGVSHTLNN